VWRLLCDRVGNLDHNDHIPQFRPVTIGAGHFNRDIPEEKVFSGITGVFWNKSGIPEKVIYSGTPDLFRNAPVIPEKLLFRKK
jgi:hypothetical protein